MKLDGQRGHFYGKVLNEWRVGNLCFSESIYSPWAKIGRHSHLNPYFCILLHGSYLEKYRGGVRECRTATTLLHPPGEVHENHFLAAGGRIFRFEILDDKSGLYSASRLLDTPELRSGKVRCLAARLYRETRNPDYFSGLSAEALALEIIGEARRSNGPKQETRPPRWLIQATELLHENLPEALTVAKIASIVGIHAVHLARVFRRHYGCGIGEYVRNWRVEIASRQLAKSTCPIAEIAANTGFADQSHLCRTFKALGGLAPKEFRAIFRPR